MKQPKFRIHREHIVFDDPDWMKTQTFRYVQRDRWILHLDFLRIGDFATWAEARDKMLNFPAEQRRIAEAMQRSDSARQVPWSM